MSSLSGVIADLWPPPWPPFARAAARPAMVRSFISSRSISATEARIAAVELLLMSVLSFVS